MPISLTMDGIRNGNKYGSERLNFSSGVLDHHVPSKLFLYIW